MIMRVLTGRLRPDVDAETRRKACEDAARACRSAKGCRGAYFTEPPQDEDGVLAITFWDSLEDVGNAVSGPLQHGLSSFSVLMYEPPRGRSLEVLASSEG